MTVLKRNTIASFPLYLGLANSSQKYQSIGSYAKATRKPNWSKNLYYPKALTVKDNKASTSSPALILDFSTFLYFLECWCILLPASANDGVIASKKQLTTITLYHFCHI